MTGRVQRTCKELIKSEELRHRETYSRPLEAYRSVPAYVLLGDPGAGKTTAFDTEYRSIEDGYYITARDFLTFEVNNRPEWRGKTLFIDGLDEVRAGMSVARVPFDTIRSRLDALGKPRFRLSCREADWLGDNDRKNLEDISPDSSVVMLRLDPLTDSDIDAILTSHPKVENAVEFINTAKQVGVEGLLTNPQSLNMLVAAVTGEHGWPQSRLETFELACREMAREHNDEHSVADQAIALGVLANLDKLLDAAGRLCAPMLISGAAGFALHRNHENADYPVWDRCEFECPEYLKAALSTKLFKAESAGRFAPVHRHIAEFLGARHLCRIICGGPDPAYFNGLPARRVIALLTGEDGMVVSELRGVSAWLAAHCAQARRELIVRDPTGVGLYGDIRGFLLDEKLELLMALKHHVSGLENINRAAPAFAALATPNMESLLREILEDPSREKGHQEFVDFSLCVLRHGVPMPSLSDILLEIVPDDTRLPKVNRSALETYIHNGLEGSKKHSNLKGLLTEIYSGKVSDPNSEMLGKLLIHLYPQYLPPSEVWGYYPVNENRENNIGYYGYYHWFWDNNLIERSSEKQIVELLDSLYQQFTRLRPVLEINHRGSILPMRLLTRGLESCGDELRIHRLYNWLSLGCHSVQYIRRPDDDSVDQIRAWLEGRPDTQKAVILEGLARCPKSEGFRLQASSIMRRLYGANPPSDFGLWCLEEALKNAETSPLVADFLWREAIYTYRNQIGNEGLSFVLLEQHAQTNVQFKASLDLLLAAQDPLLDQYAEERQRQEDHWAATIRSNETALRENRAAPLILYELAQVYFRSHSGFNNIDGPKGIEERLQGDRELTEVSLDGLRGTLNRDDIPDSEEIFSLHQKELIHYLSSPFLAGLAELERLAPEDASLWDNGRIRTALAFYFTTSHETYQPEWFKKLLCAKPKVVADAIVRFFVSESYSDGKGLYKLQALVYNRGYQRVARIVSLRLLDMYSTRCKLSQIVSLEILLSAALKYAERNSLQTLVDKKLSRTSMNVAQRAYWLSTALLVMPGKYNNAFECFIRTGRRQRFRIQHAMALLVQKEPRHLRNLGIPEMDVIIRVVGSRISHDQAKEAGRVVSPEMKIPNLIRELIECLGTSSEESASIVLDSLLKNPALTPWHEMLSHARDSQQRIRRDASFHRLTIEQIGQTLKGGTPANAGDLAALVMDRLSELAITIRDANTDDWRQYWDLPHGKPPTPRHEDHCRDTLLSRLRLRLPPGVDAQPEVHYADDKRADIHIAFQIFQVPVEVKKNSHRELWSAMHKQLIKQYVRDPATDGYGIYLVFWFGEEYTQAAPSGRRPDSPQELQERLTATLSHDEARKISVYVIDVSAG